MSTHVLETRLAAFSYPRFRLVVVDGPDRGAAAEPVDGELACGTAQANQLVLTDPAVSRHHLVITATPRGVYLRDLGSTNGTYLGGHRVDAAWLDPGAGLRVGVTTLRFEHAGDRIAEPLSADDRFGRALGKSIAMRRVFAMLPRIAASDSTVLLEGETGTGKTLVAEGVHHASRRARGPFVVVDCGAIPPTLIESELFGHEKGAFTGATAARTGAIEAAEGGTVFFDEIGELPLDLQPRLLRVLEDRTVKRVGGVTPIKVDIRIVAASNRDLREAVNRGAFRGDLYYRLNIVKLRLPPLRERRDDIALLVESFYEQLAGTPGAPPTMVEEMARHDWPGNVRELRAAVERAVLLGDPALWRSLADEAVGATPADAPDELDASLSFRAAKERAVVRWERGFIAELIRRNGGNLSRAARAARMDRTHLRELARRYQVIGSDPDDD